MGMPRPGRAGRHLRLPGAGVPAAGSRSGRAARCALHARRQGLPGGRTAAAAGDQDLHDGAAHAVPWWPAGRPCRARKIWSPVWTGGGILGTPTGWYRVEDLPQGLGAGGVVRGDQRGYIVGPRAARTRVERREDGAAAARPHRAGPAVEGAPPDRRPPGGDRAGHGMAVLKSVSPAACRAAPASCLSPTISSSAALKSGAMKVFSVAAMVAG